MSRGKFGLVPPDGYHLSTQTYPVLYMLDARWHFHHTVGVVDYLATLGQIPPMIVVGIVSENRSLDLTPPLVSPAANKFGSNKGGTDQLLQFIKTDLDHYVEQHYRVTPYRLFFGHSLGGLTVLQALKNDPKYFAVHHAMAPSLQYFNAADRARWTKVISNISDSDTSLIISIGSEEEKLTSTKQEYEWLSEAKENTSQGLRWQKLSIEGEGHSSMVHKATYDTLIAAFEPWQLKKAQQVFQENGYQGLKQHFKILSESYPFPTKQLINQHITQLVLAVLGVQGVEPARALLESFTRDFPSQMDAAMYEFWGQGYQNIGEDELARTTMKKVLQMNPGSEIAKNYFTAIDEDVPGRISLPSPTPEDLQKYVGYYQLSSDESIEVFVRNKQLWIKNSLPTRERLLWGGGSEFFVSGSSVIRYQFIKESGEGFSEVIRESAEGTVIAKHSDGV